MATQDLLFYILGFIVLIMASAVILSANPLVSALFLALTMVSLAFVFFLLEAPFIAGVQLIVYAGAVIVLFVMVMMLFDLKRETQPFSGGTLGQSLKIGSVFLILGTLSGAILNSPGLAKHIAAGTGSPAEHTAGVKNLAITLFTKYMFAFQALGVLLLLIAVGVVAVSRTKGGTHAR
jgi:NADH-quinone oxidoreductase subunit J